jgi:hypothetical protein
MPSSPARLLPSPPIQRPDGLGRAVARNGHPVGGRRDGLRPKRRSESEIRLDVPFAVRQEVGRIQAQGLWINDE